MSDPTDRATLLRRGLFAYSDGVAPAPVVADQFEIQARLADACPGGDIATLDGLLADLTAAPPGGGGAATATDQMRVVRAGLKLAPIIRAGFDLPPLDAGGRGLGTTELLALLADFLDALGEGDEDDEDDHGGGGGDASPGDDEGADLHADHPGGPAPG